jgi:hypothetical protein
MLKDHPGDQPIPHRSDGEIIPAPIAMLFEFFHQRFVGEIV